MEELKKPYETTAEAVAEVERPRAKRPEYPPDLYPRMVLPPREQPQPQAARIRCLRMTAVVVIDMPIAENADRESTEQDALAVIADAVADRVPLLSNLQLAHSHVIDVADWQEHIETHVNGAG